MAFNTIETSAIFQEELDKHLISGLTTGWMEKYAEKNIKYSGGNTIKIPNISLEGLSNYDKDEGFKRGKLTLKYTDYVLTQDRGRSFMIDAMDVDETGFVTEAAMILGEFQRNYVVPEIDCYRYSKISKEAIENNRASFDYTPNEKNIFDKLMNDITKIQEEIGDNIELKITMPLSVANIFYNNEKVRNLIEVSQVTQGEITTIVKKINGIEIITAPTSRMKTAYTFYTGEDEENNGGFKIDENAKSINWIISAEDSIMAISKLEKPRIFSPEENLFAYAWKIDYRRYHDIFLLKNKLNGIWVNIKEAQ